MTQSRTFQKPRRGGVISDGTAQFKVVDQKEDGTDIDALKTELESVKSALAAVQTAISDAENFTIIYPNGGTASKPASVSKNTRYVEDNPFPGYYVNCIVQGKVNNKWGYLGEQTTGDYGRFVIASHLLPDDKIIIQTGRDAVFRGGSNFMGDSFGNNSSSNLSTVPCRVLVYKLGKI